MNWLYKHSDFSKKRGSVYKVDFLLNLKSEMKAGDLAVIRTTESSPGDDTKVKLRSCTFPKSAWNRRSREVYFDFLGNIVICKNTDLTHFQT